MQAIIILDGLSLGDLNAEPDKHPTSSKIGRSEIARLMGEGLEFGRGPLVRFMELVAEQIERDSSTIKWLVLYDEGAMPKAKASGDATVIEPYYNHNFVDLLTVIAAKPGEVPWQRIIDTLEQNSAGLPQAGGMNRDTRFLLIGFPTEGRILAIGHLLRNMLGYPEVAVCSHLIGSVYPDAHYTALRHNYPDAGIHVFLDIGDAASYVGLPADRLADLHLNACQLGPADLRDSLSPEQVDVIQRICMQWTRVELQPLLGGFSGSLLMLASGWKGKSRTDPIVLKVDRAEQMQREIDGYHQIKDFVGRQVPKFGNFAAVGNWIGVGMELATLEGRPWTLQDCFEKVTGEKGTQHFMQLLDKSLSLLSEKLYRNTQEKAWLGPYREYRLQTQETLDWLEENGSYIEAYAREAQLEDMLVDFQQIKHTLSNIAANPGSIETDVCLVHGDLNFKNIIYDEANNIWCIDWTHTGLHPVELDFAKLENDVKFVLSKNFEEDDLLRLRPFEDFLVSQHIPPSIDSLPAKLQFARWDLRYRNILEAVTLIRRACFTLKKVGGWASYRVSLLKHALHTLSFDQRRDLGECDLVALLHASFSVNALVKALAAGDYQQRIDGERPATYPERLRVSIEQAPWSTDCKSYQPHYHVDKSVLQNDRTRNPDGWADPEEIDFSDTQNSASGQVLSDARGRPLNPEGRTGLAGRGLLGRWGANPVVSAIVLRVDQQPVEMLVGRRQGLESLSLPQRFLFPGEADEIGAWRMMEEVINYRLPLDQALERFEGYYDADILFEGHVKDPRQTDNAWLHMKCYLIQLSGRIIFGAFGPTQALGQVEWRPLIPDTINELDASAAYRLRLAVQRLCKADVIDKTYARSLLARTGRNLPC